jgi:acyl carrier protein
MKKMTDQELSTEVQKAVGTVFRVSGTKITPTTTLVADLGAESIDFLDLGCDLEKIVDTEVDFSKLFMERRSGSAGGALDITVQEVVEYLKTQLEVQRVPA